MESSGSMMVRDSPKLSPGASARKMKQSRLPFQILSTSTKAFEEPVETRKRKPSTEGLDLGHVAKAGRISEVKENVTSLTTEETRIQPVEDGTTDVTEADNEPSERAHGNSSSRSKSTNKEKKKGGGKGKRTDSPKILIKLPIGKRKRSLEKNKPVKKRTTIEEGLIFVDNTDEVLVLDDTDLSDDCMNEVENSKSASLIADEKVTQSTETSANLKNVQKPSADLINALDANSTEEGEEQKDKMALNNITDSTSTPLDVADKEAKEKVDTMKDGETTTPVEVESKGFKNLDQTIPMEAVDTSTDIDSSEDDIYMLCTPNCKTAPVEDENSVRKLTPKQIARRQEHEKRRAFKQKEKEDRRRKLLEEKEEKAREKEEQERLRRKEREEKDEQKRKEREEKEEMKRREREEREEQKRKEREEKEEQRRKEREEKEKKRQVEIEQKNEEKRLKEEERRKKEEQKEEERRKKEEQKEEERKRKEEEREAEEKRKQKVAQAFTSFFVKKPLSGGGVKASDDENSVESCAGGIMNTTTGTVPERQRFMPFCVKGDMRLAPVVRRVLDVEQKDALERVINVAAGDETIDRTQLYLDMLKHKYYKPLKSDRTWNVEDDEENDDIMVVDENVCHQIEEDPGKLKQKFKTKFFLFEENRRPPYRGTWRKQSQCIKARRPFAQDNKFFDYEVDSDDEWEEEEPGESLHGSDDEKDVDPEEEYEVDNEFFVPHGHLSDEELHAEEEGEADDNSPEVQKVKLKLLQQEFVAEMKKKTEKIKPRLIGCIWSNVSADDKMHSSECSAIIRKMLDDRAMLYDPDEPISFTRSYSKTNGGGANDQDIAMSPTKEVDKPVLKKVRITDDAIRDLARLVHGNVNNRKFLVREFHAFWSSRSEAVDFSFESIRNKIKEIAKWGACRLKGSMEGKLCWVVDEKVLEQHKLMDLTLPNDWKYHLQKENFIKTDKKNDTKLETGSETQKSPPNVANVNAARKASKDELNNSLKTAVNDTAAKAGSIVKFAKTILKEGQDELSHVESEASKKEKVKPSVPPNNSDDKTASTSIGKQASNESLTNQKSKKRVKLLMSVPRGQNINQSTKNNLISQFLCRENKKKETIVEKSDDLVIVID